MTERHELSFNAQNGVTAGVWREGRHIVKELNRHPRPGARWQPSDDPRSFLYWRRELDAYATDLPGRMGLRGPRLLGARDTAAGVELRLEQLGGRTAGALDMLDLEELATVLGLAQGRDDLPQDPWLSRRFLHEYPEREDTDHALYDDDAAWGSGVAAPLVDEGLRADLVLLHDAKARLLAIMDALPRTLCHLDLFPNNVFATHEGPAIIDWAFAGDGALGEDIGNLVPDSVFDLQVGVDELPALEQRLPLAYLAGLRAAGWRGDDRLVMLAVHASAVKYDWLGPRVLAAAATADPQTPYASEAVAAETLAAARFAGLRLIGRWARLALAEADALRVG